MRNTSTRAVVLAIVSVLAIAGAAFAYWSVSGSGSGDGDTGTVTGITVNQTSTVSAMAPGVAPQTLSGTFDNSNDGPVYVGSVSATVTGTDQVGCGADDYVIAGSAPVNAEVASGTDVGSWTGLTIAFNNKPTVDQNACKGATVTIAYTSN
jgi:hypothetical protein